MEKVLVTQKLTKVFPGVVALDNLDFDLIPGEIHSIVGENGAGKSTFIKMLSGVYQPSDGKIFINGKEMHFINPGDAAPYVGVVYQENELIPHFTGYQNLFLGREENTAGYLLNKATKEKADTLLDEYKFDLNLKMKAMDMSSGQRKMLSILKLLGMSSKILIFDEPTAQLGDKESEILFKLINKLKEDKFAVIYISHHLDEVLNISDRISVLRNGKRIITLENKNVTEKQLIKHMVAKDIRDLFPKVKTNIGEDVIKLKAFKDKKYGFNNINFNIRSGEIVGFAGLVGAGRTELAKSVFYGYKKNKNSIIIKNQKNHRFAFIPENRREEGVIVDFDVGENVVLPHLRSLHKYGFLNKKKINEYIKYVVNKFSVKCTSKHQEVRTLSGGNQQKVSIGKWVGQQCDLWIFDEPTQGIDVDAKTEIYSIIGDIVKKGSAVWMISSELQELTVIADRIYVMKGYEIVGEFEPPYNKELILNKMIGVR